MSKCKTRLDGANVIILQQCGLSGDLPVKGFPLEISDSNWMVPVSKRKRRLYGANSIILPRCGLSGDLPVKGFSLQISDSNWMVPVRKPGLTS